MVDVNSLSDAELRSKLLEFGFPVMPITGSTRKVMAKKLKLLLENRNKIGKEDRRSLGRYSSEEESDDNDILTARKEAKYKRATMAVPPPTVTTMQPPPQMSKSPTRKSSRFEPIPSGKKEIKTSTSTVTRTTRILNNARDDFDTGSESDDVIEEKSPSRLPMSFLNASSAAEAAGERLNQIRSRISLSGGYDRPLYTSSPTFDVNDDKETTPFLSNFTKRLSLLSDSPKPINYDYKTSDIIKENDVNGGSTRTLPSSYRNIRTRLGYDYAKQSMRTSQASVLKDNLVPFMVLIVAFLFFLIVGAVYLGIRSETGLEVTARIPKCTAMGERDCLKEGEERGALNLLRVLQPELMKLGTQHRCVDRDVKPYMGESDVVEFLRNNYAPHSTEKILTDLDNLHLLTFTNPAWNLRLVRLDRDGSSLTYLTNVNERSTKTAALIAHNPPITWTCYLGEKMTAILNLVISVLIGAAILLAVTKGYRYYMTWLGKRKEEEISLIENIIDTLQSNCSENDSYLVINHVRDMILPINERKNKEKVWARAVKYLNENESRIRTEIQVVRGEPSEVWRWLGGPNTSISKNNKSWQGQAFETQVGSVNSLPCSPTPCLKIRGMVEDGDLRNTNVITKAVLSKCAQQCRILHVAVDTNGKCVYLKCVDPSDAAIAYRNLHGWWYAGNLVTVKYLRLERYMQRFPNSPTDGPYLQ